MLKHDLTTATGDWFLEQEHRYLPKLTDAMVLGYRVRDQHRAWTKGNILALIVGDFEELRARGLFRKVP